MNRPLPTSPWRTLALQARFNQRGMQRAGWWFSLVPWLRRLGPEERREWLKRPRAVFNTNPYLAPVLLGARCRIEEDQGAELAERVEATMQRTLGALGDALTWRAIRPVWFLGSALAGFSFGPAAVLVSWLVFAIAVLLAHWVGLSWGYRWGLEVVDRLPSRRLHLLARAGRRTGAVLAGAVAVGLLALTLGAGAEPLAFGAIAVSAAVGLAMVRMRRAAEWSLLLVLIGLLLYARWAGSFPEAVTTWR